MTRSHLFRADPYGFCSRCGYPYSAARHRSWLDRLLAVRLSTLAGVAGALAGAMALLLALAAVFVR